MWVNCIRKKWHMYPGLEISSIPKRAMCFMAQWRSSKDAISIYSSKCSWQFGQTLRQITMCHLNCSYCYCWNTQICFFKNLSYSPAWVVWTQSLLTWFATEQNLNCTILRRWHPSPRYSSNSVLKLWHNTFQCSFVKIINSIHCPL